MPILYDHIGIIHSPFIDIAGMPIQPAGARGVPGKVIINEAYRGGLKDLEDFSHIILIYHLHLCNGYALQVKPFLDDTEHGILA
ncbi:MAG: TrmO family methyltransferase [Syntrophales bacterium]|nr:TrmO family methyltransferase [Syntrophales bacterium]